MSSHGVVDLGVDAQRMSAVLVFDLAGAAKEVDLSSWTRGPLLMAQPQNATTRQRGHDRPTDERTRRTLVASHQADAVYGTRDFERWHMSLSDEDVELRAVEMLVEARPSAVDEPVGFVALHVLAPATAVTEAAQMAWWSGVVRDRARQGGLWARASELCGVPSVSLGRGRHLSFVASQERDPLVLAYAAVTGAATETWADLEDRARSHDWTVTKPDWSVLALRDGAAYVSHQTSEEQYGPTLRMLTHSVHLDALLLALLQRQLLDRSGDEATRVDLNSTDKLLELEQSHYDFKRKYWRTAISSKRTAPVDIVFQAFQAELLTTLDVTDVEDRVRTGARLSMTLLAKAQEESARAQEESAKAQEVSVRRQREAQEAQTLLLQQATAGIGAFGLCYTAAPVITTPSWAHFVVATAVAVPLALIIFGLLLRFGRHQR